MNKLATKLNHRVSIMTLALMVSLTGCSAPEAPEEDPNPTGTPADNEQVNEPVKETIERGPDEVLRHAVFFSFKETSSEEDVQGVVDAFAALPLQIDEIIDFQWGTNNSEEGLDDGFTHCFLLTFKNEADRNAYIPHDAHKVGFADVLRPHMKAVFVIDYWGKTSDVEIEKELKHAVFFKFKDDAEPADVKAVEDAFAALPNKIDTIRAFEWGINNSPENNDHGFTHCFMVTFGSKEDRAVYLPHDDHETFVKLLMPVLDKVRVLDFSDGE